jgi:tRNA (pseudouridine54-N1)-methyltransferase
MREFIYYSRTAPTSGGAIKEDLSKSGRLDIAIHSVIASFFLSHKMRDNVKLHLLFAGPPNTPRHLEWKPVLEGKTGVDKIHLSKGDVSKIIKKMLYKCSPKGKREIFPGYWVEEKGFIELVNELIDEGKEIFMLDDRGEDIRKAELPDNAVFIMGDHRGLPKKEFNRLKKNARTVSIGKKTYFASHTIAIVHNELDRRDEAIRQE